MRIGFMPENTYLYKHLTGREFLEFNGSFFGSTGEELKKIVKRKYNFSFRPSNEFFKKERFKNIRDIIALMTP